MAEELPQTDSFWKSFNLKYLVFGLLLLGLFVFSVGIGLLFFRESKSPDDIQIISADSSSQDVQIMVHVDGAVRLPGLYKIKADGRVNDAIVAAGGLSADADSQKINLAAKVSDGMKVHVARVGEEIKGSASSTSITSTTGSGSSGLVNINTGSQLELEILPGIGPVTAQKIISSRPYLSVDELLVKKVVSRKVFGQIKDLVTW